MNLKFLFCAMCFIVFGRERLNAQQSPQEKLIDSLKKSSLSPQHDTLRAAKLDMISYYYQRINPDSGVAYARASFLLAQKANWERGQILALMDWSSNFQAKSMFYEGIEKGELALKLLENENMPGVELAVLSNLSLVYKDLGYTGKALEYLIRAFELESKTEGKVSLPIIFENIGSLYVELKEFDKADSLFELAYAMQLERGDSAGLARSLSNKARVEQQRNHTEKAISLFKQALDITTSGGNWFGMQVNQSNLGIAYMNLKQYDSAIVYHEKALRLSEQLNSERSIAINAGNLGQTWYERAQEKLPEIPARFRAEWLNKAKVNLERACTLLYQSNFRGPYLEFSEYLTEIYLQEGNYKTASHLFAQRLELLKLVNEEEEKVKMVKMESQRILEINALELARNKQDLEIAELKLGLEKRNSLTVVLILVFLISLGVIIMLYLKKRGDYHKAILNNISLSHSHEIRGPLARIMGLADLLKNDLLEEKDKEYIYKSIEESAKELDRNISDIIYKSSHEAE